MGNFQLRETYATDIQTDFRFELLIEPNAPLGLTEKIVGYIQSSDLPCAPGEPIVWHLPGGMKNHQAGKRTIKPLSMQWVTATAHKESVIRMCEKWAHATYDLNRGTNIGKALYCTDGIYINLKGEDDTIQYSFHLLRAQITDCDYGTINSESNELLKVSCTMVYDDYEVRKYAIGGAQLYLT